MVTKVKAEKPLDTPVGAIMYTDGGSRANYGGYGIHGYTYSDQKPIKGSGNTTQYLTNLGYVPKVDVKDKTNLEEVKPLQYINSYSSFSLPTTNNVAELAGAINALNYAVDNDLKYTTIFTDSEMVVKGANSWISAWKKNDWIKSDGQPVANKTWWVALDNNLKTLKDKGTTVTFKWVKGHSTHLGNQLADKLATIGVLHAKDGKNQTQITVEKADGYWSNTVDKNPFITQKRIYFTTRPEGIVAGEYYLGDHGKDDDMLGKRTADGCYSYIVLNTPEPAIEMMRNKQVALAGCLDVIIMARLDKIFEANTYKDIMTYGDVCFYTPYKDKLDMYFVDSEPVTRELRPPRLAMRAIEQVNILKGIYQSFMTGKDTNLVETDITNLFYDVDNGHKLKPEYVTGFTNIVADVFYNKDDVGAKDKIDLCLGVDLPERNYLKRMEKLNPVIKVLTWMESDKMFRYVTVIKAGEDSGIFGGMYSNSKYI